MDQFYPDHQDGKMITKTQKVILGLFGAVYGEMTPHGKFNILIFPMFRMVRLPEMRGSDTSNLLPTRIHTLKSLLDAAFTKENAR